MIAELIAERAADNVEETYLAVGSQGDGARVERWQGGSACLSSLGHPVSNFAVVRALDAERARQIYEWAAGRRAFNVYLIGEAAASGQGLLDRLGFYAAGRLEMMVGEGDDDAPASTLDKAETFQARLEVCRFMARQFFSKHTSALRESIALATTKAHVDLYSCSSGRLVSAAMIRRTPGMAGIYNVCVAASERERGHGSELLAGLLRLARADNLLATLQCEPGLEPWYARRGLQSIGSISVLTLDRKASHAIM